MADDSIRPGGGETGERSTNDTDRPDWMEDGVRGFKASRKVNTDVPPGERCKHCQGWGTVPVYTHEEMSECPYCGGDGYDTDTDRSGGGE